MRKQILIITSLMLCYLQGHSQSSGLPKDRGNGESPRADTRRIPSPATSVRTFTYDAAGNRILMETPTRNAQASPGRNQPRDGQADVTCTADMLRIRMTGEFPEPYGISIYNIAGQTILERHDCRGMLQEIPLFHLRRGVYIVDVCAGDIRSTRKITIE